MVEIFFLNATLLLTFGIPARYYCFVPAGKEKLHVINETTRAGRPELLPKEFVNNKRYALPLHERRLLLPQFCQILLQLASVQSVHGLISVSGSSDVIVVQLCFDVLNCRLQLSKLRCNVLHRAESTNELLYRYYVVRDYCVHISVMEPSQIRMLLSHFSDGTFNSQSKG